MEIPLPRSFFVSPEVARALELSLPVVALESTVITHGLPRPQNLHLAREMEQQIFQEGATAATVAVLEGQVRIGLTSEQLEMIAQADKTVKVSRRDFASALMGKKSGGTTVAGTMFAAHLAGIEVFATGGIGGVHRESRFDVSTDLTALGDTPMVVVCAGAKAILDLPATLEYLETLGVPVVGYQTDRFPAFYSVDSGLGVSARLDSPEAIAGFARTHWGTGLKSGVLVVQPPPKHSAINKDQIDPVIQQASREASEKDIHGQELTPFLLKRINELTDGKAMRVNLDLLTNNARLAAQIARVMAAGKRRLNV